MKRDLSSSVWEESVRAEPLAYRTAMTPRVEQHQEVSSEGMRRIAAGPTRAVALASKICSGLVPCLLLEAVSHRKSLTQRCFCAFGTAGMSRHTIFQINLVHRRSGYAVCGQRWRLHWSFFPGCRLCLFVVAAFLTSIVALLFFLLLLCCFLLVGLGVIGIRLFLRCSRQCCSGRRGSVE